MAIQNGRHVRTPEETAAIVSATAVARGVDVAKTAIVGILGRGKPFVRVHVGLTDVDLGKTAQERGGYTVTAMHSFANAAVAASVAKAMTEWLRVCHGKRHEADSAKQIVKPGTKTLYVAVAYA
jgi:hypothetical protein